MREAIERGYIGGKLTADVTFKFTPEMKERLKIEADTLGMSEPDLVREVMANFLVDADLRFKNSLKARGIDSELLDTLANQQKSPTAGTVEPCVQ